MFDLDSYLADKRNQINSALNEILQDTIRSCRITDAMTYSIMAGGKRLRAILCLATTEAIGGIPELSLKTACALELVHTYSLIHDDLPAMDNDDLRRGRRTCHIEFDEATAILTGDAMLTLAFEILSSQRWHNQVQAAKYLRVIQTIALATGRNGMISGQMMDISSEGIPLSIENIDKMYALKTGALIEASVCSGAIMGEGTPEQLQWLGVYAKNIGLAFQIIDDVLNIQGDPKVTGKAAGTDQIRRKSTYPALIGVKQSIETAAKLIDNALKALDQFDIQSEPLRAIAQFIIKRKK